MVLRSIHGVTVSEDAEDLKAFLLALPGAHEIQQAVLLGCLNHDDETTWTYVEADAATGIARRRCLQCASTVALLDSAERWTHPPMWSCGSCHQSIAEVAVGLSLSDGDLVRWVVVAARCVECGRVDGLTDMVLPDLPLSEVLVRL